MSKSLFVAVIRTSFPWTEGLCATYSPVAVETVWKRRSSQPASTTGAATVLFARLFVCCKQVLTTTCLRSRIKELKLSDCCLDEEVDVFWLAVVYCIGNVLVRTTQTGHQINRGSVASRHAKQFCTVNFSHKRPYRRFYQSTKQSTG